MIERGDIIGVILGKTTEIKVSQYGPCHTGRSGVSTSVYGPKAVQIGRIQIL